MGGGWVERRSWPFSWPARGSCEGMTSINVHGWIERRFGHYNLCFCGALGGLNFAAVSYHTPLFFLLTS